MLIAQPTVEATVNSIHTNFINDFFVLKIPNKKEEIYVFAIIKKNVFAQNDNLY
jgi:hypothetical protein